MSALGANDVRSFRLPLVERRLRERVVRVARQRDEAIGVLHETVEERDRLRAEVQRLRKRPRLAPCPYCGHPCHGPACFAHRDLVEVDPYFASKDPAAPTLSGEDAPGSK